MPTDKKIELVNQLRHELESTAALLLTDYRGLTVSEITALRRKLQETGSEYRVVKNSLLKLATQDTPNAEIAGLLVGPTAVIFIQEDPIASAKVLVDFMKDHKAVSIKGGLVESQLCTAAQVQSLSKVLPREVLLSQLLGAMQSPIANFVGTCQGVISNLVYTLQAVSDKKAA